MSLQLQMRRSTILADARLRGGFGPLSRDPLVRVGNFSNDYEWPGLRGNVDAPARARRRVGADRTESRVGLDLTEQPWLVVSTTMSRDKPESKTAIPIGSLVRFTVQRGLKAAEDESEMVILRGRVVAGRSALLPDSYGVQETEVVLTHDLDPSVATPAVGQVFLVAPGSVGSVESIGSEPPPTLVIPSTSEFAGMLPQTTASAPPSGWTPPALGDALGSLGSLGSMLGGAAGAAGATGTGPAAGKTAATTTAPTGEEKPIVKPSAAPGTPDSLATKPAGPSGASIAIAIGVFVLAIAGFAYWRLSP